MNRPTLLGALCTGFSLVGYLLGVLEPYGGRSLTLSGLLVGLTLIAVGGGRL
jgi:hypothetical protein